MSKSSVEAVGQGQQPRTDVQSVFDDDYLYFYDVILTPESTDREVETLARLCGVGEGTRVLDHLCGPGRISARLARRGAKVVGVDGSPAMLATAVAASQGLGVEYVQGDQLHLPWHAEFDLALIWHSSFGFGPDATSREMLAGLRRALRPGGKLLIDHMNRDRLVQTLVPGHFRNSRVTERGADFMLDRFQFNPVSCRLETDRVLVRGGAVRRTAYSIRLFTVPELSDWLLQAGFSRVTVTDGDGGPVTLQSNRLFYLAHV